MASNFETQLITNSSSASTLSSQDHVFVEQSDDIKQIAFSVFKTLVLTGEEAHGTYEKVTGGIKVKFQNGLMIQFGEEETVKFAMDMNVGTYIYSFDFLEPFLETPFVFVSPIYAIGIPEKTGVVTKTASSCKIGCNAQFDDLYIQWIAVGRWK